MKSLITIVLETGKLERPYLGVRYVPLNEDVARELGIEQTEGAYIPVGTTARPSILPAHAVRDRGGPPPGGARLLRPPGPDRREVSARGGGTCR